MTLSGCQSLSPLTAPDLAALSNAQTAVQNGEYSSAAQQFEALALTTGGIERSKLYLQAASAYWQLGEVDKTQQTLAKIDPEQLTPSLSFDIAVLKSLIVRQQDSPEAALALLTQYPVDNLSLKQQQALYQNQIELYQMTENWLEKANNHISLDALLSESQRKTNQQQLWQALMQLTPTALDLFNPGGPPAIDSGWFALAYLIKSYQSKPQVIAVALEDWRLSYPFHPADPNLYLNELKTETVLLPEQIDSIAVLLPEQGRYQKAAAAIRQGILASHYAAENHLQLHFLTVETDATSNISNSQYVYQQAIDLNVDLVIGPLDKTSIDVLSQRELLPIPVLALNRMADLGQKDNLFQFGLAPEDDVISATQYAVVEGFKRAIIVAPESQWGHRIANAFETQWLNRGGTILRRSHYQESEHDYSLMIKPLFDISNSENRKQRLRQTINRPIEFEPRRRQDIDFIFLVAKSDKARQIVPQFKYHRSGQLPIIMTSYSYSGTENAQQDIDLNGTLLTDIPWAFSETSHQNPIYRALTLDLETSLGPYLRFFALGVDAYQLIEKLSILRANPEASYQGVTGQLQINDRLVIQRLMNWGTFSEGRTKLLSNSPSINEQ